MQPILINKGDIIHYGLNDYSDSHRKHLYQYDNEVYYFFIHNVPERKDDIFIFNTNQKLIVLLYPKGLISFKMSKVDDQWQPEPKIYKTVSTDILELIKQKLIFKPRFR